MTAAMLTSVLSELERRRQELGMTVTALARRSGVSRPTVNRILSGDYASATMWNVMAVAEALGMKAHFSPQADDFSYLEQQAEKKARNLVGMVQGTMGLEAQGLGSADVDNLVKQTTHQLLGGSRRKLWE